MIFDREDEEDDIDYYYWKRFAGKRYTPIHKPHHRDN